MTESQSNTLADLDPEEVARLIATAIDDNTGGVRDKITDLANDIATDRANDAIASIPTEVVGTCDPGGTIEVLVR